MLILIAASGEYALTGECRPAGADIDEADSEDEDIAMPSATPAPFTDDMDRYWQYIQGMMTNLGAMSAARIQTTLTMFLQAPNKYTKSQPELERYLERMVDADKLAKTAAGEYQLK